MIGAKTIEKKLKDLDDVTAVSITDGNALSSEYMRGMANGLMLAQSIFKDVEPAYITAKAAGE